MARPPPHPKSFPATPLPQLLRVVSELAKRPPPPAGTFMPLPPTLASGSTSPKAATASAGKTTNLGGDGGVADESASQRQTKKARGIKGGGPDAAALLYRDDECLVCNDAFPKAAVHCLVLPLDTKLRSLNDLHMAHLPLLRHMYSVGCSYAQFLRSTSHPRLRMICGFHALPSLPMLHMHLISMDLQSTRLKHRKHYNSFTTNFFLTAPRVIADLEAHGYVTINQNVDELRALEAASLKCVWCGAAFEGKPVSELQAHLATCSLNAAFDK